MRHIILPHRKRTASHRAQQYGFPDCQDLRPSNLALFAPKLLPSQWTASQTDSWVLSYAESFRLSLPFCPLMKSIQSPWVLLLSHVSLLTHHSVHASYGSSLWRLVGECLAKLLIAGTPPCLTTHHWPLKTLNIPGRQTIRWVSKKNNQKNAKVCFSIYQNGCWDVISYIWSKKKLSLSKT